MAISDAPQTLKIVAGVRSLSSTAHIIVRTRYVKDIQSNFDVGANEVMIRGIRDQHRDLHRVLRKYLVPEAKIAALVASIRSDRSGMLRGTTGNRVRKKEEPLKIPGLEIATLPVSLGRGKVVGKTVAEIALREKYGITVLAIRRGERYITNVNGEARILTDDLLYLLGSPENIVKLDHDLR